MNRYALALVAAAFSAAPSLLRAADTSITLYPNSPGVGNVAGSSNSAPGFPTGSFQAPGVNKSEIYILPSSLFSGSVTVGDIASVSYFTNKSGGGNDPDWSFYIYTNPTGSGDTGSFYHSRLTAEPLYSGTPDASDPAGAWHEWSTNDPAHPLRFYDSARNNNVQGTGSDPTLATLQAGTFTWPSGTSNNYNSEAVKYFSLQTGSGWANGFTGLLDGLTITLKNGDVGTVNFESVAAPLPSAAWGGIALLGALGYMRLKSRRSAVTA